MRVLIALLTVASATLWAANETTTYVCGKNEVTFTVDKTAKKIEVWGSFASAYSGELEADDCVWNAEFDDWYKSSIKNLSTAKAACISISTNGGDGDIAILHKDKEGKYKAEIKSYLYDSPEKDEGRFVDCAVVPF